MLYTASSPRLYEAACACGCAGGGAGSVLFAPLFIASGGTVGLPRKRYELSGMVARNFKALVS